MTITNFVDDGRAHPFTLNPGVISLLTSKVYEPWMVPREIVSNAYDQYIKPRAQNRKPEITIGVSKKKQSLIFVDNATGIEDIKDFMVIGNSYIEGIGKFSVDEKGKSFIDPRFKGQYHIAKGSFHSASDAQGDKVIFLSNDGEWSTKLIMRTYGWAADPPERWRNDDPVIKPAIPEIGLAVQILEPKKFLLEINELRDRLSHWFGIMLEREQIYITIYDVDTETKYPVHKPKDLKIDNELLVDRHLQLDSGHYITCRLEKTLKPVEGHNIQVFVKYVGITSIHVDYLASGWINCDALSNELNLARNGFNIDSDLYIEVKEKLNNYLEKAGYKKQERHKVERVNVKGILEIANKIQTICNKIFPDRLDFTGSPNNDNPQAPSSTNPGNNRVKKPIEDRGPRVNENTGSDTKPSDDNKEKKIRKIKKIKHVWRKGGTDENRANVKLAQVSKPEKPLVYFSTPETLCINYGRDSSWVLGTCIAQTMKKRVDILIPLMAHAAVDQRMKMRDVDSLETWSQKYEELLDHFWGRIK